MSEHSSSQTTVRFFWVAAFFLVGFWLLLSILMIGRDLWPVFGGDPGLRATIAAYSGIGPGKAKLFQYAVIGSAVTLLIIHAFLIRQPGRLNRTIILVAALPFFWAMSIWIKAAHYYHEQGLRTFSYRLNFHELENGRASDLFLKFSPGRRPEVTNFKEYAALIDKQFDQHENLLNEVWNLPGSDVTQAAFYLSHVSALWAFGEKEDINQPGGCVTSNTITGLLSKPPEERNSPQEINFKTYWRSPIGCCTDYTVFLYGLLENAGIENRIVHLVEGRIGMGHSLNEAKLGGKWWVLDANTGIAFNKSWETLLKTPKSEMVDIYLFPHPGLNPANENLFRTFLGSFRMSLVNLIAARNVDFYRYPGNTGAQSLLDPLGPS